MHKRGWHFLLALVCGLAWPALAQQPAQPPAADSKARAQPTPEQSSQRKITLGCAAEGRLALRIATAYFVVNGRSRDATLAYAARAGEAGKALAGELFGQVDAGSVTGAPRFATLRINKCLDAASFPMDREVTPAMSDLCWARSDVIYQSMLLKEAGKSREEAEAALRQGFTNTVAFPTAFLQRINKIVYDGVTSQEQAAESQSAFYMDCLVAEVRAASRK